MHKQTTLVSPSQTAQAHPNAWRPSALSALSALIALGCSLAWSQANAQAPDADGHGGHSSAAAAMPATTASQELSEGEVTRWTPSTGKITLRHGELKNLNMPPMTMVFTVQDPAQASQLKKGDKVRFRAEQVNGAFVATHLEPVN